MTRAVGLLLVSLSALPVGLAAQRVPADNQTVTTELDTGIGNGDHLIWVSNRSSVDIIVTSVRLTDCENIQGSCSVIRRKNRVPGGARVMVHRVRPRYPDEALSFRYGFTWEEAPLEGPTAKDVARDSTALVVDTVFVSPAVLDIAVGETLDLSQVLAIRALNAAGADLKGGFFFTKVIIGEDLVTLEGIKLTGKASGTAALLISASLVAGPNPPTKGATKVLVRVTP